jgi:hypothetical protein
MPIARALSHHRIPDQRVGEVTTGAGTYRIVRTSSGGAVLLGRVTSRPETETTCTAPFARTVIRNVDPRSAARAASAPAPLSSARGTEMRRGTFDAPAGTVCGLAPRCHEAACPLAPIDCTRVTTASWPPRFVDRIVMGIVSLSGTDPC